MGSKVWAGSEPEEVSCTLRPAIQVHQPAFAPRLNLVLECFRQSLRIACSCGREERWVRAEVLVSLTVITYGHITRAARNAVMDLASIKMPQLCDYATN